ncbi:TPA: hypothetical protein ACFOCK_000667, partial [Neisseria meningitidis]
HIQNRAVFFYSYRDVTIIFLTPVILIALSYLIKNKEILSACILCITLIAFSWAWIIIYRPNTKRFFLSLLIVWGKLLFKYYCLGNSRHITWLSCNNREQQA